MAAKITFAEVAKHRTRDDCWMVIDGKVYDVTSFMEEHPGGDEVLVESSGKDATLDFEDIGHSNAAREQLADFYVGDADIPEDSTAFSNSSHKEALEPPVGSSSSSGLAWKVLQLCVPLVALGIAYYVKIQLLPTEV